MTEDSPPVSPPALIETEEDYSGDNNSPLLEKTPMQHHLSQHSTTVTAPSSSVSDDDSREEEFHQFARVPFRRSSSNSYTSNNGGGNKAYKEQLKDHSASNDDDQLDATENSNNLGEFRRKRGSRRSGHSRRGSNSSNSSNTSSSSTNKKGPKSSSHSRDGGGTPTKSSKSSSSRHEKPSSPEKKQQGGGTRPLKTKSIGPAKAMAPPNTAGGKVTPGPNPMAPPMYAILPPPDPSSSSRNFINLLVCTANLGNAAPDADSWNAWIPKDGRLVEKTRFPVRMHPPQQSPPPPPGMARIGTPGSPRQRKSVGGGPPSPGNLGRERKTKGDPGSPPKRRPQRRTRSGGLVSMILRSSSSHDDDPEPEKNRKPARRSRSAKDLMKPESASNGGDDNSSRKPRRMFRKRGEEATNDADGGGDSLLPANDNNRSISNHSSVIDVDLDETNASSRKERRRRKKQEPAEEGSMTLDGNNSFGQPALEADKAGGGESSSTTPRKPRRRLKKEEGTVDSGISLDSFSALEVAKGGDDASTPKKPRRRLKKKAPMDETQGTAADSTHTSGTNNFNDSFALETPGDGYEAYLETLKDPYTLGEVNSPNITTWKRERPSPRKTRKGPSKKSLSIHGDKPRTKPSSPPLSISPGSLQKPRLKERRNSGEPKLRRDSNEQKRRNSGEHKRRNSNEKQSRQLPRRTRSGSSHDQELLKTPTARDKPKAGRKALRGRAGSLSSRDLVGESTPDNKPRRVLRSKSSTLAELVGGNSSSRGNRKLARSNSSNLADTESPKSGGAVAEPKRRLPTRTKSSSRTDTSSKGTSGKGFGGGKSEVPDCRKINEAEISVEELNHVRTFDVKYPEESYSRRGKELGCYDIIVIGMQEATFSTDDKNKKHKEEHKAAVLRRASLASKSFDSDEENASQSDSENESDMGFTVDDATTDDDSLFSMDDEKSKADDEDLAAATEDAATTKSKKKKKKGFSNPLKKISKATSKTAKTVNTFAGGGKDHTERPIPVSAPTLTDDENDIITGTIETVSSGEMEDEDVMSLDGMEAKKFKKWTDTDVIHHGIESNQLQGYTRALSYQFGQMRLLVYYKTGTTTSREVLKTLDVLSVSYQATGKAGLANKGGIVAEVAVNNTTKLSFLTAHLEAHEGIKHYNNRNNSLQDILSETGGSKYFDSSQSSHFTFAMGDLNYRTKLAEVAVGSDRHIQFSHSIVERRDWRLLNQYDELRKALTKQSVLTGFQTAYCNFPPTFKVQRQEGCSYNPARSPSYTDRILFKSTDQLDNGTKLLLYEPVVDFTTSDHKPIRSGFSIRLNRELRWKSTAELLMAQEEQLGISVNNLGAIIPETSKGSIDADRETMHLFITNIECVIDPSNYDHIRKQDKAELPNPKLLFITNPVEALLFEDSSKKRRLKLRKSTSFKDDSLGNNPGDGSSSKKLPSTSTSKDTMRPIWKDDHIYFALKTHTEHGRPIDFSGAQLHMSLVDNKTGGTVIGSHCVNLAHLVIRSREKAAVSKGLGRSKSLHGGSSEDLSLSSPTSPQPRRISSMKRVGSKKGMERRGNRPESQRKLSGGSNEKFNLTRSPSGDGASIASGASGRSGKSSNSRRSSASGGSSSQGGYNQLLRKPSPALRTIAAKFGQTEGHVPEPVRKAASTLNRIENGNSKIMDSILADLDGGFGKTVAGVHKDYHKNKKNDTSSTMEEFGLRSIRLQETLIEGGLITGHIKCDIDIWWT